MLERAAKTRADMMAEVKHDGISCLNHELCFLQKVMASAVGLADAKVDHKRARGIEAVQATLGRRAGDSAVERRQQQQQQLIQLGKATGGSDVAPGERSAL